MGIRAKQLSSGTFDATTAGRAPFGANLFDSTTATSVFVDGAIPGAKIANAEITETQLNASVAGDGIDGGAGTALSVNVSDIAGTGLDSDGGSPANLRIATSAAGTGLTGGGGAALSIDTGSTVNFSAATPVWTFGNETTGEGLFVTGAPVDGNHVPNKTYVDNQITGLTWIPPVAVKEVVGSEDVTTINGLSPTAGDAYVMEDAGTINPGGLSVAAGDIVEYSGSAWVKIVAQSGGFPPDGTRALASTQTALNNTIGLAPSTDEGKILEWDGTSLTPGTETPPDDGNAVLVNGDSGYFENLSYTFDGTVPTGSWIQFGGPGVITAGNGLTGTTTFNVQADTTSTTTTEANAINVSANGVSIKVDDSTIEGSEQATGAAGSLRLKDGGITGAKLAGDISFTTTGDITANSFTGDGSALTNLPTVGSADTVAIKAFKSTSGTIAAGLPVYLVGYSGGVYTVEAADADTPANMPAIGITAVSITDTTPSGGGFVVTSGEVSGLNTGSWSAGDPLYVSDSSGLTNSKPTGADRLIQKIAEVAVSDGSAGIIQVFGAGRSNDVPNIAQNAIWIGNASAVATSTAIGNGLTSTPGTSLTVTEDTTGATTGAITGATTISDDIVQVTVSANGVAMDVTRLNGDHLDIDFGPSNYTPDAGVAQANDADDLAAHLKGIDDALGTAGGTVYQETLTTQLITGANTALTDTLNNTPASTASVKLYLNGVQQVQQGTGTGGQPGTDNTTSDYSISGTTITWLAGTGTAVDMDTSDVLQVSYEA